MNRTDRRTLARTLNRGGPGMADAMASFGFDRADSHQILNQAAPNTGRPGNLNPDDVDKIVIPDTAAGLEEMLSDPKLMARIFTAGDAGPAQRFVQNYARAVMNRDNDIAKQVQDQVKATLHDWRRELDESGEAPFHRIDLGVPTDYRNVGAPGNATDPMVRAGLYSNRAMGHAINNEFASLSEYFQAIWHQGSKDATMAAKLQRVRNAFSSTVPSEGGFLIPEQLRSDLLRVSLETALMRPGSRVIPMETLRVPFPCIDETSHASSVYGGITASWTAEGAALSATSASFGRVILDASKLTMYTEAPNELISDSIISFEAFIREIFPEAMGFYEDDAFITGTGVGMPLGVLLGNNVISVAKETSQLADTIVYQNPLKMYARMLPSSLGRAVWFASIDTFPELATMALNVGTAGSAVWLTNAVGSPPVTIFGRPVMFTEKVPKLGDAKDLSFVDRGMYLIGDRQVMSATSSAHYKYGNDMTAYRIISRVDGRPWMQSAITPKNGGATLSPTVTLAERA